METLRRHSATPKKNFFRKGVESIEMIKDESHFCKVKQLCQSCPYINLSLGSSLKQKFNTAKEKILQSMGEINFQICEPDLAPKSYHYRCSIKLVADSKEQNDIYFGLYKPNTHEVIQIDQCPVQRTAINHLVKDLTQLLRNQNICAYHPVKAPDGVRYLLIRSSHLTDEIMLSIVCGSPFYKQIFKRMVLELKHMGHKIYSSFMILNNSEGNVIVSDQDIKLTGPSYLREELLNFEFEFGPKSFFQINPWQAEKIYSRIAQHVGYAPKNQVAWDLYAGVGPISMVLKSQGYSVISVEEIKQACSFLERNYQINFPQSPFRVIEDFAENIGFHLTAEENDPHVVVVNPSRRGLAETLLPTLSSLLQRKNLSRLIYLSCDIESFLRDAKRLNELGFQLKQLEAFDMFPQTEKLEWLAIFVRTKFDS